MKTRWMTGAKCPHCRVTKACCTTCGACSTCGGCRPRRCTHNIPQVYVGATYQRNSLRRAIGVEYEIGSFNEALQGTLQRYCDNEGIARLRRDRDSSVRPSEVEWVTRPIVGDDAFEVLTFMSDLLNRAKSAKVDLNCGYHVHVDACKETTASFRHFLAFYMMHEAEVYSGLCEPTRIASTYCSPLLRLIERRRGAKVSAEEIFDMKSMSDFYAFVLGLYGIRAEEQYDIRINRSYWLRLAGDRHAHGYERNLNPRYCGMNIHAWYKQGSIEWRMKEMTLKHTKPENDDLVYWPLFCGHFTHIGLSAPPKVLMGLKSLKAVGESGLMPKDVSAWLLAKLASPKVAAPQPAGIMNALAVDAVRAGLDWPAAQRIGINLAEYEQAQLDALRAPARRMRPEPEEDEYDEIEPRRDYDEEDD